MKLTKLFIKKEEEVMNFSREEIIEAIEDLENQAKVRGAKLHLDPKYIYENKQHCYWYGGTIGSIDYKGCTVCIQVIGDLIATLYDVETGEELVYSKDKSNNGRFYDEMRYFIKTDEELESIITRGLNINEEIERGKKEGKKYVLYVDYNNWIEFTIYDNKEDKWVQVSSLDSVIETDDVLEAFTDIEFYLDIVEQHLHIKKYSKKAMDIVKDVKTLVWCFKHGDSLYVNTADIADDERFAKVEIYNDISIEETLKEYPENPTDVLEVHKCYIDDIMEEDDLYEEIYSMLLNERVFPKFTKRGKSFSGEIKRFLQSKEEHDFIMFACDRP
jgi:hypothetical protein